MGQALQLAVALTSVDCGSCGGTYAINERFRKQCQDYGRSWTCPYCKTGWGFSGNGELEKTTRELAAERQRLQAALSRENAERAEKNRLERKLKRVNKGVCPECKRTFQNLARHMCTQHGQEKSRVARLQLP